MVVLLNRLCRARLGTGGYHHESDSIGGRLVLIGLAILLHGVFHGAEVALLSAQKSRLQQWKDGGKDGEPLRRSPGARNAGRFLTTIQIVMTFMDVFAAVLAGAVAILKITPWLVEGLALPATFWTQALALGLMIGVLTCVGLLVGQLVPKPLRCSMPNRCSVGWPVRSSS